jgi:hypothetical protein
MRLLPHYFFWMGTAQAAVTGYLNAFRIWIWKVFLFTAESIVFAQSQFLVAQRIIYSLGSVIAGLFISYIIHTGIKIFRFRGTRCVF